MLGVSHVTAPAGPTYTPASCMPVWYAGAPRHLAEHSGAHPAASEVRLHELQLVSTLFPTPPPVSAALPPSDSRSEEHTADLQSLMRISYAVFCLKKKKRQ